MELLRQMNLSKGRKGAFVFSMVAGSLLYAPLWLTKAQSLTKTNVTTQHNDTHRTGSNTVESFINASNVGALVRLTTIPLDGQVYAQPLFVSNLAISGQGNHDVVFVATENNSVYALDANNFGTLWQICPTCAVSLGTAPEWADLETAAGINFTTISPQIGLTSTPVIDTTTNTMYAVAKVKHKGQVNDYLYAIDITAGTIKKQVAIQAMVPGTGAGSSNGTLIFDPAYQLNRPGLLLYSGTVYVAYGEIGEPTPHYHGWIMSYNASSLAQVGTICTSPNAQGVGVWQGGSGLAADGNGNIYLMTGNLVVNNNFATPGNWSAGQNGSSFLRLRNSFITGQIPSPRQECLDVNDLDLGMSGPAVLPGTSLLVGGSKEGWLYLVDGGSMAQIADAAQGTDGAIRCGNGTGQDSGMRIHGSPVVRPLGDGSFAVYVWGEQSPLNEFIVQNGQFRGAQPTKQPVQSSTEKSPDGRPPENEYGGALSLSPGIVWAALPLNATPNADTFTVPGRLVALDATTLKVLWSSDSPSSQDNNLGFWAKFNPPTIANGKVFVGTFGDPNTQPDCGGHNYNKSPWPGLGPGGSGCGGLAIYGLPGPVCSATLTCQGGLPYGFAHLLLQCSVPANFYEGGYTSFGETPFATNVTSYLADTNDLLDWYAIACTRQQPTPTGGFTGGTCSFYNAYGSPTYCGTAPPQPPTFCRDCKRTGGICTTGPGNKKYCIHE